MREGNMDVPLGKRYPNLKPVLQTQHQSATVPWCCFYARKAECETASRKAGLTIEYENGSAARFDGNLAPGKYNLGWNL
jgi:hypothetical protein